MMQNNAKTLFSQWSEEYNGKSEVTYVTLAMKNQMSTLYTLDQ